MSRTSSSSSSPRSMMEMEESEMRHAFFLQCGGDGEGDRRSISWGGGRLRAGDGGDADMIHVMFWAREKNMKVTIASIFIIR